VTVELDLDSIDFEKGDGLVTVVAIDAADGAVLMVAHADRDALQTTLDTGEMHYRSRTRGAWHKGATSGAVQRVIGLTADCDGDAVLAVVRPAGPSCHTGERSCFGEHPDGGVLQRLDALAARRAEGETGRPGSHVDALLQDRNLRLKKLGEEATELAVAASDEDRDAVVEEAADLLFHSIVVARAAGVSLLEILEALVDRER
jgi:phosphoribosyl-ATP pyrophosphohydrolase/phosphoribosyl-AMP cyclohydrolase